MFINVQQTGSGYRRIFAAFNHLMMRESFLSFSVVPWQSPTNTCWACLWSPSNAASCGDVAMMLHGSWIQSRVVTPVQAIPACTTLGWKDITGGVAIGIVTVSLSIGIRLHLDLPTVAKSPLLWAAVSGTVSKWDTYKGDLALSGKVNYMIFRLSWESLVVIYWFK